MNLHSEHFYWRFRYLYYGLINLFLDKKISVIEFTEQISSLWVSNQQSHSRWKYYFEKDETLQFEPDSRALGFEELASDIFTICEICNPDEDRRSHELNEEELRLYIQQNTLPKIEKYLSTDEDEIEGF